MDEERKKFQNVVTDFEYVNNIDEDRTPLSASDKINVEIAFQLKRIADTLEGWTCEGALGTYECNAKR